MRYGQRYLYAGRRIRRISNGVNGQHIGAVQTRHEICGRADKGDVTTVGCNDRRVRAARAAKGGLPIGADEEGRADLQIAHLGDQSLLAYHKNIGEIN